MTVSKFLKTIILFFVFMIFAFVTAKAQGTSFTYQGKLTDGGSAANGQYDFTFRLFSAVSGGSLIGSEATLEDIQVSEGVFTVTLDFGSLPFAATSGNYLEIAVRAGTSNGPFTMLVPRQPITSSPYSVRSFSSASADSLTADCVLCVTDSHILSISGAKVNGTVATATNADTAATAGNVTGIVQIANGGTGSATKSFIDLTTDQTNIGGNKQFIGAVSVSGPNGVFSGNGSGLTNLNAPIADGSITTPKLSDGSVTEPKLAAGLLNSPQRNLSLLGMHRWDLLKGQANFVAGSTPRGIEFDGANIWISNSGANSVSKLRATDGVSLGTFTVGAGPQGIAFDGSNVWVANPGSTSVTKLRASDGSNLGAFPVGSGPWAVAFDGANIWVTNSGSGTVTKLRASDGSNLGTFAVGLNPVAIVFDGTYMWVGNNNSSTVTKLRASDGSNFGTFSAIATPTGIGFDGTNIWVSNGTAGTVTRFRAIDGNNLGTVTVGGIPNGIAFDGTNIWVANDDALVTKIRVSDGVILGAFPVFNNAAGAAFDGTNIWVTVPSGGFITRLPPAFP